MGIVIPFPKAPSFACRTVSKAEAEEAQAILFETMGAQCRQCAGRGVVVFQCFDGEPGYAPCPCGGTDSDRIDIEDLRA